MVFWMVMAFALAHVDTGISCSWMPTMSAGASKAVLFPGHELLRGTAGRRPLRPEHWRQVERLSLLPRTLLALAVMAIGGAVAAVALSPDEAEAAARKRAPARTSSRRRNAQRLAAGQLCLAKR
jgi:hypothetical protein